MRPVVPINKDDCPQRLRESAKSGREAGWRWQSDPATMMAGNEERPWDTLPAPALVTIFRKLPVEDRFKGGPLVCRSWKDASRNPRCWESMLPEGECPEFHFIKNNEEFIFYPTARLHILGMCAFIERSGGGATTLYFWHRSKYRYFIDDEVFFFIAERCPKLKHLSLRGCRINSEDGFLKLVGSCQEIELLDLSDACQLSSSALQEMGRRWPKLRGLRRNFWYYGRGEASAIATSFPKLQLLNLYSTQLRFLDLSTILKSCTCLQFLDVTRCRYYPWKQFHNISQRIPEVLIDDNEWDKYWSESEEDDRDEYIAVDSSEYENDDLDEYEFDEHYREDVLNRLFRCPEFLLRE